MLFRSSEGEGEGREWVGSVERARYELGGEGEARRLRVTRQLAYKDERERKGMEG